MTPSKRSLSYPALNWTKLSKSDEIGYENPNFLLWGEAQCGGKTERNFPLVKVLLTLPTDRELVDWEWMSSQSFHDSCLCVTQNGAGRRRLSPTSKYPRGKIREVILPEWKARESLKNPGLAPNRIDLGEGKCSSCLLWRRNWGRERESPLSSPHYVPPS